MIHIHFYVIRDPAHYLRTKILPLSKLKALADDIFNVAETVQVFYDKIENNVGRGENADYQHCCRNYLIKVNVLPHSKIF